MKDFDLLVHGLEAIFIPMATIELRCVTKKISGRDNTLKAFSPQNIPEAGFTIKDLNLIVPDRKTLAVIGPSGCGKTTLLRLISGLDTPDKGEILFNGIDLTHSPAKDRRIGMVFQNYALYPHLKNKTNILSFFLFRKKTPEMDKEAEEKLKYTSEVLGVDISYLLERNPSTLSGGEKQRVALGRCITRDPSVFLLDEPLSNLDAALRMKYRVELKRLLTRFGVTAVYVTHDQSEAFLLGDIIAIMRDGRVIQTGSFDELYKNPSCLFVAEFMNPEPELPALNVINAELLSEGRMTGQIAGFRPSDAHVRTDGGGVIKAGVAEIRASIGKNQTLLRLVLDGRDIFIRTDGMAGLFSIGSETSFDIKQYFLFDKESGARVDKR
jgi:multiple sugar transport system ATP-binding protein